MGKFTLMALPYAIDALEPVISKQTLEFHHGKHLAAYVNNLNGLLDGSGFEGASLEEIVCKASGGILNNAGQILNHELYFGQFSGKPTKKEPTGALADAIVKGFGSFEAFKEEFQKKGATLFGSGWVWWEHAYYLDYQNRRPDHLSALWSIINWEEVELRFGKARM